MNFKTIFNNDSDIINLKILGNFLIEVEIRQAKTLWLPKKKLWILQDTVRMDLNLIR